jgi:hypothetical protein
MKIYRTKIEAFAGTSYKEINRKATGFYQQIKKRTKRRPYVRSAYFGRAKVFLGLFWSHLRQKNYWDQTRRWKYFSCGIELISKSKIEPVSKENPNKTGEILHRFAGATAKDELFFVQIKEDKQSGQKWLMSIFPVN